MGRFRRFVRRAAGVGKRLAKKGVFGPKGKKIAHGISAIKKLHKTLNPARGNVCDVVEAVNFGEILPNKPYACITTLGMCKRALKQSPYYQEMKLTKVQWEFQPYETVFGNTTGANLTVSTITCPQLLYTHQPNGFMLEQAQSLQSFQEMGCKPQKFTKDIIKSYSPTLYEYVSYNSGLLSSTASYPSVSGTGTTSCGNIIKNKWITTLTASSDVTDDNRGAADLPYYGAMFYAQQTVTAGSNISIGRLAMKCHWSFRYPYDSQAEGGTLPLTFVRAG